MAEQTPRSAPALDDSTRLAFERTRNSYENTMMSWIRTATSLITFGFSIYKFFQIEAPSEKQQKLPHRTARVRDRVSLYRTLVVGAGYP